MIDYLPLVLTGIGIIVSILYYTSVLRNANSSRELQIFMDIIKTINQKEHQTTWAKLLNTEVTDYDDYMEKYDSRVNPEHYGMRGSIWWNYNAIGRLMKRKHISVDLVHDLMGLSAVLQWNKWGDIILNIREKQELPNYFDGFEYLVTEMIKYREHHPDN